MTIKELKQILKNYDDDIEVCANLKPDIFPIVGFQYIEEKYDPNRIAGPATYEKTLQLIVDT